MEALTNLAQSIGHMATSAAYSGLATAGYAYYMGDTSAVAFPILGTYSGPLSKGLIGAGASLAATLAVDTLGGMMGDPMEVRLNSGVPSLVDPIVAGGLVYIAPSSLIGAPADAVEAVPFSGRNYALPVAASVFVGNRLATSHFI